MLRQRVRVEKQTTSFYQLDTRNIERNKGTTYKMASQIQQIIHKLLQKYLEYSPKTCVWYDKHGRFVATRKKENQSAE